MSKTDAKTLLAFTKGFFCNARACLMKVFIQGDLDDSVFKEYNDFLYAIEQDFTDSILESFKDELGELWGKEHE